MSHMAENVYHRVKVPRDHLDRPYGGHLIASTCFVGPSLGLAPHEMVIALDYLWPESLNDLFLFPAVPWRAGRG